MSERTARKRLYSHVTRSRFLHLEDALEIGKIRLFAGSYRKGNGASATAFHFLDLEDARVIFSDLAWAKPVEFTDYKGTDNGDGPQSRVLKVKSKEDKVWLEVANGPGEIVGQGAVKPKGKPDAAISIPLTTWEARKLAHAVLAYVRAWEARHLLAKAPAAPSPAGEGRGGGGRGAVPAPTTASSVATEPADQVAAGVTTGQDTPATATDFWTLYNEQGKPAGVSYPVAQQIAETLQHDWRAAIAQLADAIAQKAKT